MDQLLLGIIIVASIALVANVFLKKYDVPPIIGYIFSGAVIATIFDISSAKEHVLGEIAEMGIVFLMFTIGLELRVENLKELKKQVFTFGSLQVGVIMALFTIISFYLFNFDIKTSLVIGSALALSSTAIVLKMLSENGTIESAYGKNTLGILIFQDLSVIPILLMITIMTDSTHTIGHMLFNTVISAIGLVIVMIVVGKYLLEYILKTVTKTNADELFILTILIVTLMASYLAHILGFTYSLGAFLGGMLIAETHYKHQVEADLIPFRDLLLAVFFVTVGMQIDISFLISNIVTIISLGFIIMVLKAIIIFGIIYKFSSKVEALQTALAISQVGEFSFVIFTQATSFDLIDKNTGQMLTLSVIASMIVTPFIVKNLDKIVKYIFKKDRDAIIEKIKVDKTIKDHIILCGYGTFGQIIAENLKENNLKHNIIIDDFPLFENALKNNENAIFGDPTQKSILLEAGLKDAKVVLIALHSIKYIELISHAVRLINKDVKIVAKVNNKDAMLLDDTVKENDLVDVYFFAADIMSTRARYYLNDN